MSGVVHVADWVVPVSAPPLRNGAVWIEGGRIRLVGTAAEVRAAADGAEEIRWPGTLLPGLVNAHTHLQYTSMAEVGRGSYTGFEDWSRAFQVVYDLPDHDWGASAADGVRQAIAAGTTALADVVTDPPALSALRDAGAHGIAYWEVMAWVDHTWNAGGARETVDLLHDHGLDGTGLSPHAPYSLDTGVLTDVVRLAREMGIRQHLHLAESAWEDSYTLTGTGQLAEQWRAWGYGEFALLRKGGAGQRPVEYAESIDALGPTMHIAHGIYTDAADREILRRHGTAIALCPRSNAVIGLDEAPVAAYLREGNVVGVGTDSLSSSPSLDLLGETRELVRIARAQGYTERDLHARILDAVTRGGARAMGLDAGEGRLGVLEPGAMADIAVSEVTAASADDLIAALTEDGEGRNLATIIEGTIRWTHDRLQSSSTAEPSTPA